MPNKSPGKKTAYGVYIIESLRSENFADGENLHDILGLVGIISVHQWADTVEDVERFIQDFKSSNFRYLHFSCHADETGLLINGEKLSNSLLELRLSGGLQNKRIFMAACRGGNRDLAEGLVGRCRAYSLIGTPVDLPFEKSVIFWPTFYHLMNEVDEKKMIREDIKIILKNCVELLHVPINYYSRIDASHIRRLKVRAGKPTNNTKLNFGPKKKEEQ